LIVNGLAKSKALPIAVFLQPHRSILWLNEQKQLSSSLNSKPMTTRFATCGWQSGKADESIPSNLVSEPAANQAPVSLAPSQNQSEIRRNRPALIDQAAPSTLPVYETHQGFKYIGESLDEDKKVPRKQDSAGFSFKGHYSEEDGIVASLLAAEASAARRTQLVSNFSKADSLCVLESFSQVKDSQGFGGVL
jgi:hypothetical protein